MRPQKQPLSRRARFWIRVHSRVNRAAWRWARPPGPLWGSAERINQRHILWRLNNWTSRKWIGEWLQKSEEHSEALDRWETIEMGLTQGEPK